MTRGEHLVVSNLLLAACAILTLVSILATTGALSTRHHAHWIAGTVLFAIVSGLFWFREAWKATA